MLSTSTDFVDHFSRVEEPRVERTKKHGLLDILFISVAGTIAGCDGPTDIASFAKTQLSWCRRFVELKNGVPSHDTIGRVISLLRPEQFQKAFLEWIAALAACDEESTEPRFVPIDGKTLRGSGGAKDRENPLHVVRRESRYYAVAPVPKSMKTLCRGWKGIKSIGQAITATTHMLTAARQAKSVTSSPVANPR